MLTDEKTGLTPEKIQAELAELEADYKRRRRTLRALLAALEAEETSEEEDE